jgi:hypothetical protein
LLRPTSARSLILLSTEAGEVFEAGAGERVGGVDPEGGVEPDAGELGVAAGQGNVTEVGVWARVGRVEARGGFEGGFGFVRAVELTEEEAQAVMTGRMVGIGSDRRPEMPLGFGELFSGEIDLADGGLGGGVGRIEAGDGEIPFEEPELGFAAVIGAEEREVFFALGKHLQPELGHFIGGLRSVADAPRRMMRVARVVGRVIEGELHGERGAFWKRERRGVAVIGLPVEVPVVDADERLSAATGQCRPGVDLFAEKMGVREDRQNFGVDRQDITVANRIIRVTRWNIHRDGSEQNAEWRGGGRRVGKVKADAGLNLLGFAAGAEVHLDNEVVPGAQFPGEAGGNVSGQTARLPAEEMSGLGRNDHAGETEFGIEPVAAAAFAGAVELDQGVMNDLGIARAEFEGAHIFRPGNRNRDDEIAVGIGPIGREKVRFGHRDDEVGRTEVPIALPGGQRREIRRGTFRRTFLNPLSKHGDLEVRKAAFPDEPAVAFFRRPGRHITTRGDREDVGGVLFDVGKGEERERRGLAGAMAAGAVFENDWGDVFVEGQFLCGHGERCAQRLAERFSRRRLLEFPKERGAGANDDRREEGPEERSSRWRAWGGRTSGFLAAHGLGGMAQPTAGADWVSG